KIGWQNIASCQTAEGEDFYNTVGQLLLAFAAFNPHATFHGEGNGTRRTFARTATEWQKWRPSTPPSPHWYTAEKLKALIAAYLTVERETGKARKVPSSKNAQATLGASQTFRFQKKGFTRHCLPHCKTRAMVRRKTSSVCV